MSEAGAENSARNSARRGKGNPEKIAPFAFKPGRSGNPGGRPKRRPITDKIKAQLEQACEYDPDRTNLEAGVRKLIGQFVGGAPHAQKLVLEYVEGPPTQTIDIRDRVKEFAEQHGLDAERLYRDAWEIMKGGRP